LRVFEVPGNPSAGAAHDAIDREVDSRIERIDQNLENGEIPLRASIILLSEIPGVGTLSVITILSEIGRDMSGFRSPVT
jgi:transposase